MNKFPTPDQIRESVIGKDKSIKMARVQLIAKATAKAGKSFVFKQADFGSETVEKALLEEVKSSGWSYDLVNNVGDGNYYIFRPLMR